MITKLKPAAGPTILDSRNWGIDFLRGLSILYIVGFWHLLDYATALQFLKTSISEKLTLVILGCFVFVSGYLLGPKLNELNKQNILRFYKRRFFRIYPLYLIALILFSVIGLSSVKTTFKAAICISMFLKPAPLTLWFITMLVIFYAISPLLVQLINRFSFKCLLFTYIVVMVFYILFRSFFSNYFDIRLFMYLPSFTFGIFAATQQSKFINKREFLIVSSLLGIVISYFGSFVRADVSYLFDVPIITLMPCLLSWLFTGIKFRSKIVNKLVSYISYSSYCMYLFHRVIYFLLFAFVYNVNLNHFNIDYLFIFSFIPLIVVLSYFTQMTYDKILSKIVFVKEE